ncbi:disease resistance protein RPP8 [Cryptomeria japonica]|uniref:disease resistance protein RPP8 n=1 Tax=Cryptomeria japonica TaxID=3369 RepID=UPI0027DA3055|nr:disease resistance protein RPP8 [Cryptomeria japonica]
MASILAEGVVGKVCEMAIQQVANEVSIVYNFSEDFERLKNKMRQINHFLNEADEKSSTQKESVKEWLQSVRDIAWEAEDLLQICAVDSTNSQSCTLSCNQLILRHQMGRRIQKVKARVSSVIEDGNQLNIGHNLVSHVDAAESSNTSQRRKYTRLSVLPSDSKPVGIQSKIDSMVNLLESPQFPIIAVVGMGGLGKTYLLQHVYNAQKGRYEKSVWLSVSQFYSFSKLLNDLAFQLDEDLSKKIKKSGVSEEVAAESIYSFMQGKKCLIVLDDVWRATREGDLLTKLGIPTGANGQCQVLVSTRSREVSANLKAQIYEMGSLTDGESWKLFCVYAFPESEENRAPEPLEEVALKIVKECGNLPLAIKTTAASLANTSLPEWQSKLSKLKKVSTPSDPVMDILKLSYDALPAHLKACFAYLSFFPEDEEIECEYPIYLWMGEGFVPAGDNPWDCLYQLANLCLLEVWEDKWLTKYCKIHDLLLDLTILISRENKCAFSVDEAFSKLRSVNTGGGRWCRLFLAKKDIHEHVISERRPVSPTLVRTLSLSHNTEIGGKFPAKLFYGMRVLRVLDLSNTNISTLPACVGQMKLLKVLNLSKTKINKVPDCVRYLKSLCYLNVFSYHELRESEAPKWISELRCLQHLEGPFERMPKGISKLEALRTLRVQLFLSLSMEEDDVLRLEDVGKMSEIEEIAFKVEDESQLKKMEEGILAPLLKLRRLVVENGINGMQSDLPQFPERMGAMRDLECLILQKFAVPSWICCLANLRYLCLRKCDCINYPELQTMPNLVSLSLQENKRCRELPKAFGKSGGFPHLRFFWIYDFPELEEFPEMEDGAMACLEKLEINYCKKVNKVGEGLERLRRVKEFRFERSGTDELRETLKEGGSYWEKGKTINSHITIILY